MSELKNENINVNIEKLPGCEVKLEITVSPKATESAYAKALKNLNKEVVLPGFRKGKAPTDLLLQKFKPQVEEEWRSVLLNTAFHDALQLVKMNPLSRETIRPEIKSISLENGSVLSIRFETRPDVPEINSKEITLKNVPVKAVTEKDIEDRMEELKHHQAKWEDITDRGIIDGDFVHLDIESLDEPGTVICKDQAFLVSKGKIGDWLYQLLLNKNLHDVFEGTSEKEPCDACEDGSHDHSHEEFKPTKLQIKVQAIKKAILPEVNEEFASKLGAESIEKLKERVVLSLEKNFKEAAQEKLRAELKEIILKKYPFDIPASIIASHGKNLDEETLNHLKNSYRILFITEKLAHELKLDITQDEIMQEFMVQAYMTNPQNSFIDPSADPKEIHHRIRSYLLEKKVNDYLIDHASRE